jgi:hypothetical protein
VPQFRRDPVSSWRYQGGCAFWGEYVANLEREETTRFIAGGEFGDVYFHEYKWVGKTGSSMADKSLIADRSLTAANRRRCILDGPGMVR